MERYIQILLICGKKFCNKRKCGIKINNGKINSSLYHNIICNGNNTPFLLLKEGRIYFFLNKSYINSVDGFISPDEELFFDYINEYL